MRVLGYLSIIIVAVIGLLIYLEHQKEMPNSKRVTEAIEGRLDHPSYWFMMSSYFGGWEKVILVFGYHDNYGACEELKKYGTRTSPDRKFRCERVR